MTCPTHVMYNLPVSFTFLLRLAICVFGQAVFYPARPPKLLNNITAQWIPTCKGMVRSIFRTMMPHNTADSCGVYCEVCCDPWSQCGARMQANWTLSSRLESGTPGVVMPVFITESGAMHGVRSTVASLNRVGTSFATEVLHKKTS